METLASTSPRTTSAPSMARTPCQPALMEAACPSRSSDARTCTSPISKASAICSRCRRTIRTLSSAVPIPARSCQAIRKSHRSISSGPARSRRRPPSTSSSPPARTPRTASHWPPPTPSKMLSPRFSPSATATASSTSAPAAIFSGTKCGSRQLQKVSASSSPVETAELQPATPTKETRPLSSATR